MILLALNFYFCKNTRYLFAINFEFYYNKKKGSFHCPSSIFKFYTLGTSITASPTVKLNLYDNDCTVAIEASKFNIQLPPIMFALSSSIFY